MQADNPEYTESSAGEMSPPTGCSGFLRAGGLIGGYLGAHLKLYLPETALRLLLGTLAAAVGTLYAVQILH